MVPADGVLTVTELDDDARPGPASMLDWADLPALVERYEPSRPRWVWPDTSAVYPRLLQAGVPVARAYDLRAAHASWRRPRT